ncbi:MAG: DUF6620 family protein [Myxococcota bacterium]
MIEYEYLCEAITAWKEGRRPEPLTPSAAWDDNVEQLESVEQLDGEGYEYAEGQAEQAADGYEQPAEGYETGAPAEVPSSGTEPIPADAIAAAAGPTEGWEQPQDGPELQPYNPEVEAPAYAEGEPNTAEFSQEDLQAAEGAYEEAADVEDVDIDEDDDDEEEDFERDYDLEEVDDQAGFDFMNDLAGYFAAELKIEEAWEDKATRIAKLNEYAIRDEAHYYQVKATLERYVVSDDAETRYGGLDAIMQIQANARQDQAMGEMQARAQGELAGELEPVEGISLEQWAHAQAGVASGGDVAQIIAGLGIDQAHWDRVSAEWNARMSRDTTATIATEYGKAFSTAGQGQYAGAAAETADALNPGGDVGDQEPVPLDRYVEIMVAQSAAADQGRDANEVLAQFGMNAMEWGQIGGWWGQKIARHGMENEQALLNEFNAAQAKWEAHYGVGDADEDVEF